MCVRKWSPLPPSPSLEGWPHPSPSGSSLPTSQVTNRANPKGILPQSPGLRPRSFWAVVSIRRWRNVSIWVGLMVKGCPKERGSYPGSTESGRTYPNGVACVGGERGHNPVGVETWFARYPRVAPPLFLGSGINTAVAHCEHLGWINGEGLSERAGSQPWAGGHNPFGIAFNGIPDLWVTISGGQDGDFSDISDTLLEMTTKMPPGEGTRSTGGCRPHALTRRKGLGRCV